MNETKSNDEAAQNSPDGVEKRRSSAGGWPRWLAAFQPPEPAPPLVDADEIASTYSHWRRRVLITSIISYACYYFVRKNLSVAMPAIGDDLGITKADLGMFLTLHGLIYGVSKFVNGIFGDQANARVFMTTGLVLAAAANIAFGMSSAVVALGVFWMINGYVQGMGFPPCARVITHWFAPRERATVFSVWNTSHSLGAAGVLVLTGFLVGHSWRLCFFVPAGIALAGALLTWCGLRDTPAELGLPEVEEHRGDRQPTVESDAAKTSEEREETSSFRDFLWENVFSNRLIWVVSLANFFVYVARYAILDWGPSFLKETRGVELSHAGLMVACFEIGGVVGTLAAGFATDRLFRSHAGRTCVAYMTACAGLTYWFWRAPSDSLIVNSAMLAAIGFCIYGPQCLVAVIATNLATKRAAATAIGLTGLFGYVSTVLSGWGLGLIVDRHGWDAGFLMIVVSVTIAAGLFIWLWNVNAETELRQG